MITVQSLVHKIKRIQKDSKCAASDNQIELVARRPAVQFSSVIKETRKMDTSVNFKHRKVDQEFSWAAKPSKGRRPERRSPE